MTSTLTAWAAATVLAVGQTLTINGSTYVVTRAGTTGATQPA